MVPPPPKPSDSGTPLVISALIFACGDTSGGGAGSHILSDGTRPVQRLRDGETHVPRIRERLENTLLADIMDASTRLVATALSKFDAINRKIELNRLFVQCIRALTRFRNWEISPSWSERRGQICTGCCPVSSSKWPGNFRIQSPAKSNVSASCINWTRRQKWKVEALKVATLSIWRPRTSPERDSALSLWENGWQVKMEVKSKWQVSCRTTSTPKWALACS